MTMRWRGGAGRGRLLWAGLLGLLLTLSGMLAPGGARAAATLADPDSTLSDVLQSLKVKKPSAFQICKDQTYALCATARCFVFNEVAYCKCDVEHGDSISLPFRYDTGKNVCDANAEGADNGYMISTYSLPPSVVALDGDQALYTCPGSAADGAYAQCDGGYCFKSTQGQRFPGFDEPLKADEIICSCPITVADPETAKTGYQIAGPYPCQRSFFKNCRNPPAGGKTGDTIYVGAPSGTAVLLTRLLDGSVPPLHRCHAPRGFNSD
jgi:hypothetical protein